jgi:pimeloyl-ACP methyl ester carboxylesterase
MVSTTLAGVLLVAFCYPASALAAPGEPAPRWAAPATVNVVAREIKFQNDGATLSGTLYSPTNRPVRSAMVVTHGASSATRDLALYRHLIEMLPPLGMAVLVYDRRGSGKSTGELAASDYAMLARDAIAGRSAIARDLDLNASKIGFWGLSQGGWLAMLASTLVPDSAFAVSVSAPLVTPDIQMNFATESILRIRGYGDEDVKIALRARNAVDSHLRGEMSATEADPLLAAARGKPWFQYIYMSEKLGDPKTSRWLKEMRHDPLATIDGLKAPVLLIYGAEDPWIPVEQSIKRFGGLGAAKSNARAIVIPGVDHAMMGDVPPSRQIDPKFFPAQAPNSAEYFALLSTWLAENGLTSPPGAAH